MRIVIGYEDGESSDAAIDEMRRAGLGDEGVEARVISVAPDVGVPVDPDFEKRSPALAWLAKDRREAVMADAKELASKGAARLRGLMPGWNVEAVAAAGVAHRELTRAAEEWPADLLVVGSHGRGVMGRLFHGSVAQMAVNNCRRNVRIARKRERAGDAPPRLLVADDGSPAAEAAVEAVAARKWPAGTQAAVVFVVDLPIVSAPGLGPEASAYSGEMVAARRELIDYGNELAENSAQRLRDAGLSAKPVVLEGHPRYAVNDYAQQEGIDCVFLGARGHRVIERFMLGSVADGVAAGAPCSVEVVRPEAVEGA